MKKDMSVVEIADVAGSLNKKLNADKKLLDGYKATLKDAGKDTIIGDKYEVTISNTESQKFNPDLLLAKVKDIGANWLLKEVVDEDKLESEIITKKLNAADFADCIESTPKQTIRFKAIKKPKIKKEKKQ